MSLGVNSFQGLLAMGMIAVAVIAATGLLLLAIWRISQMNMFGEIGLYLVLVVALPLSAAYLYRRLIGNKGEI